MILRRSASIHVCAMDMFYLCSIARKPHEKNKQCIIEGNISTDVHLQSFPIQNRGVRSPSTASFSPSTTLPLVVPRRAPCDMYSPFYVSSCFIVEELMNLKGFTPFLFRIWGRKKGFWIIYGENDESTV
ncbi:hypothetical protein ACS0TY_027489 [Phlomoides rotata]